MKREEAETIVNEHMLWSVGAAAIPIPMIDVTAVTAIQLDMLRSLCKLYEVPYSDSPGKVFIAALTGNSLLRMAASGGKFIPGFGSMIGWFTLFVLYGASTYAIGQVAIDYLEEGKHPFSADVDEAKAEYDEAFEEGKEKAKAAGKKSGTSKKKKPSAEEDKSPEG